MNIVSPAPNGEIAQGPKVPASCNEKPAAGGGYLIFVMIVLAVRITTPRGETRTT